MCSASLPTESNPTWWNWSGNISHKPPTDGSDYYFAPKTLAELKSVVQNAATAGVVLRVSGQRHSQPPLVIGNNAGAVPSSPKHYLVDMSCYADLGPNGDQNMVVDVANKQITVNTGVREDDVDEMLTQNNLMMRTVTAGGFFSLGGMTAVDVHGATIDAPIFAGTVASYTILKADGTVVTIDENTPGENGWQPMQFARVNLGGLGVVTSVTLNVLDRPYADTLKGGITKFNASDKSDFISQFQSVLDAHDRVESFYNPFADGWITKEYLAAWWDVVDNPPNKISNKAIPAKGACELAAQDKYGAPSIPLAWEAGKAAQNAKIGAGLLCAAGMSVIDHQVTTADENYSDLWLTTATRVMFMSYFVELPKIDTAGLGKVYDALEAVGGRMKKGSNFYIAAPMEFRFITGGDAAMSGTYTTNPGSVFVNLDLIGYVDAVPSEEYQPELLQFFADIERVWVGMGGFPHNGKMYGFYDPKGAPDNYTAAFNPNFLADLRQRRGDRLTAYHAYIKQQDPNGLFYNDYLKSLLEG